ncbi:hypothetical protein CA13_70160 [Planctomycetes bacterium CA13]|uniref:Uncharacterized protein n=1 Tax=Novipirellula herctigrandis TaxID=2527986 RepID=A0A5C5YNK5_9BACT|nr:hypothetical protein CA13_70160 [Planctomycetes bacterium CA13]
MLRGSFGTPKQLPKGNPLIALSSLRAAAKQGWLDGQRRCAFGILVRMILAFEAGIKQTVAAPERRSPIVAFLGAQIVFEYRSVCLAVAWVCGLCPGLAK